MSRLALLGATAPASHALPAPAAACVATGLAPASRAEAHQLVRRAPASRRALARCVRAVSRGMDLTTAALKYRHACGELPDAAALGVLATAYVLTLRAAGPAPARPAEGGG